MRTCTESASNNSSSHAYTATSCEVTTPANTLVSENESKRYDNHMSSSVTPENYIYQNFWYWVLVTDVLLSLVWLKFHWYWNSCNTTKAKHREEKFIWWFIQNVSCSGKISCMQMPLGKHSLCMKGFGKENNFYTKWPNDQMTNSPTHLLGIKVQWSIPKTSAMLLQSLLL